MPIGTRSSSVGNEAPAPHARRASWMEPRKKLVYLKKQSKPRFTTMLKVSSSFRVRGTELASIRRATMKSVTDEMKTTKANHLLQLGKKPTLPRRKSQTRAGWPPIDQ